MLVTSISSKTDDKGRLYIPSHYHKLLWVKNSNIVLFDNSKISSLWDIEYTHFVILPLQESLYKSLLWIMWDLDTFCKCKKETIWLRSKIVSIDNTFRIPLHIAYAKKRLYMSLSINEQYLHLYDEKRMIQLLKDNNENVIV